MQNCVSCGVPLAGKFCHNCGEKAFDPHDHSFRHFAEQLLHAITHLDGKFLQSLKHLFFKPGALTSEHLAGRKKLFTNPLALFVITNMIYFLVQPLGNVNTFNSNLRMQTAGSMLPASWARGLVEQKIAARQTEFDAYEKLYNAKSEQLAKSLIILQIPMLAALVNLLYVTRRRFFFDHLIFTTHFYGFMLWVNIALTFGVFLYRKLGGNVYNLEVPLLVLTGIYFIASARKVYCQSWPLTLIKGILLTGSFVLVLFAYRVILFLVTFLSV